MPGALPQDYLARAGVPHVQVVEPEALNDFGVEGVI
jgi:hypothetical protein